MAHYRIKVEQYISYGKYLTTLQSQWRSIYPKPRWTFIQTHIGTPSFRGPFEFLSSNFLKWLDRLIPGDQDGEWIVHSGYDMNTAQFIRDPHAKQDNDLRNKTAEWIQLLKSPPRVTVESGDFEDTPGYYCVNEPAPPFQQIAPQFVDAPLAKLLENYPEIESWFFEDGFGNPSNVPLLPGDGVWLQRKYVLAIEEVFEAIREIGKGIERWRYWFNSWKTECSKPGDDSGAEDAEDCDKLIEALKGLKDSLNCLKPEQFETRMAALEAKIAPLEAKIAALEAKTVEPLTKIAKVLAIEQFPFNVPENLNHGDPSKKLSIKSLPQFLRWVAIQMDTAQGRWPVKLTVEDTEPFEDGKQSKKITIANSAEATAELFGMLLTTKQEISLTLRTVLSIIAEVASTRKALAIANDGIDILIDYLNPPTKEEKRKLKFTFNPLAKTFGTMFDAKEIEYAAEELDHKRKGANFQSVLAELVTGVAILRAAFLNDLSESGLSQAISRIRKKSDKDDPESRDFDRFTEDIEQGFIATTGITDNKHPWGRHYDNRPKVREIGEDADSAEVD